MKTLIRGEKAKISDLTSCMELEVEVMIQSENVIDITCFGLDKQKKLSDDRYMIFYNQVESPGKEIFIKDSSTQRTNFYIDLSKVPTSIGFLVFTGTIDGEGTMSQLTSGHIYLKVNGLTLAAYNFNGSDFQNEKAIIISEIYFKDIWRISAVGRGFDGGLDTLLKHFGGEVMEEQSPQPGMNRPIVSEDSTKVSLKKIQLEKKLEQQAPKILSLAKKAKVSLEKLGLHNHDAKVALCLDISGSMSGLYRSGKIQEFAERILALGTRFDDDGAIDIFLFGKGAYAAGELSVDNFSGFIKQTMKKYGLEGATYYGKVMKVIREHYFGEAMKRNKPLQKDLPTYVMFVTDGATGDESSTRIHIQDSSYEPIFWQFMAIGKSNKAIKKGGFSGLLQSLGQTDFTFLEELDNMEGRYLDNANFFSVEDPSHISDEELYNLLLSEYSGWVNRAHEKGMLKMNL